MSISKDIHDKLLKKEYNIQRIEDIEQVITIARECGEVHVDEWVDKDLFQRNLSNGAAVAFAITHMENNPVGIVYLSTEEQDRIWIEIFQTHPDHVVAGVGRYLVDIAKDFAQQIKARVLFVDAEESNQDEIYLFKSAGFEVKGEIVDFYEEEKAIILGIVLE